MSDNSKPSSDTTQRLDLRSGWQIELEALLQKKISRDDFSKVVKIVYEAIDDAEKMAGYGR